MYSIDHALKAAYNSKDLLHKLASQFLSTYKQDLATIQTAILHNEAKSLAERSHYIKGSLVYLGAEDAHTLVIHLEKMGNAAQIEEAYSVYQLLEKELAFVAETLAQIDASR